MIVCHFTKQVKIIQAISCININKYYKGIKVDGATYNVHVNKEGITYSANGSILTGLNLSITPLLDKEQSIEKVLNYVQAKEYRWQSEYWSNNIKERTGKANATYYPQPELVIRAINNKQGDIILKEQTNYLVYKILSNSFTRLCTANIC